jgi:hypothetical protein
VALRGVARDKWTDLDFIAVIIWLWLVSLLALYRSTRLLACIAIITLLVPIYMFEIYLHLGSSKAAFTQDLRAHGIAAYPRVSPNELMELWRVSGDENPIRVGGREVLPLAGIPDSPTVYCQSDEGGMVVYRSDSLGFRNVATTSSTETLEFALLGDSFVHGYCVRQEDTYAAHIGILGSTRNFGIDGTSVLAQLAIYSEYVQLLKTRHLIWFFYAGNDLHGFAAERSQPLLRAYLTPSHSQDLVTLNGSIAAATKRYIDQQLHLRVGAAEIDEEKPLGNVILDFLFLRKSRDALLGANVRKLGQMSQDEIPPSISETEWREIAAIWQRVVERQHQAGGDITFVYIPSVNRFAATDRAIHLDLEETVRGIWHGLGVDHISFTDLLLTFKDPLSLYSGIHFTREGYAVTAKYLVDHIDRLRHAADQSSTRRDGASEEHLARPGSSPGLATFGSIARSRTSRERLRSRGRRARRSVASIRSSAPKRIRVTIPHRGICAWQRAAGRGEPTIGRLQPRRAGASPMTSDSIERLSARWIAFPAPLRRLLERFWRAGSTGGRRSGKVALYAIPEQARSSRANLTLELASRRSGANSPSKLRRQVVAESCHPK